MTSVAFSAVLAMFNDERHLAECLSSLKLCEEIIVIDLGSTDNSRAIAEQFGATILTHPHVPFGQLAHPAGYDAARNDWLFVMDPDEVVEEATFTLAAEAIQANADLAAIQLPMQNYFLGKALTTTIWGVGDKGVSIVNRKRTRLVTVVHDQCHPLPGYKTIKLSSPRPLVRHFWVDDLGRMFEKHLRYIRCEGESRYVRGERYSVRSSYRTLRQSFMTNFIELKGWKGGWRGWFLSAFHLWYTCGALLSLKRFQQEKEARHAREISG